MKSSLFRLGYKNGLIEYDAIMVEEECLKNKKTTNMETVALRTSRAISTEDCSTRQKSDVGRAARKAKRIRFLVNGDRFCKGNCLNLSLNLLKWKLLIYNYSSTCLNYIVVYRYLN